MTVQVGLCRTWSETPKTCFLTSRLIWHPYTETETKKGGESTGGPAGNGGTGVASMIFWTNSTGLRVKSSLTFFYKFEDRDYPTFSKQGPGTNDFGKNNTYISQIGKMDAKQNRG